MTSAFFLQPLSTSMAAQNYRPSSTEKRCSSHQVNAVTSERSAQPVQHEGSKQQSFIPYQEFEKLSKAAQGITTIQQDGGVYVDGGGVLRIKALSDTAASRPQASNGQGYTSQLKTDKGTYTTTVVPSGNGDLDFYLTNDRISGTLAAVTIPYDLQQLMQAQFGMPMLQVASEEEGKWLGILSAIWYFSMSKTVSSLQKTDKVNPSQTSTPLGIVSKENKLQGLPKFGRRGEELCVDHDMKCTDVPNFIDVPWLGGMYRVDFRECCEQHDIDLWCGPPEVIFPGYYDKWLAQARWYSTIASAKLAACILNKFASKSGDIPWYYNFGFGTAYFIAFGLVVSAAYAVGTNVFDNYTMWTKYYPQDGRNKHSCLCGGTNPTYHCENRCRDLCKEKGKPVSCYRCGWKCALNDDGSPRVEQDVDLLIPCCHATFPDNATAAACGLNKSKEEFEKGCPTGSPCVKCKYRCEKTFNPSSPLEWRLIQPIGRRCCTPIPPRPNRPCKFFGETSE